MKKWKVALIGCGSIADNTYLPRIGEIPEADLVAVCDIIPESAKNYAEKFHVPAWYTSIDELLEMMEISHLRKRVTGQLSAGESTRVNLCKAFLNQPELLMLDEPTASLDPDIADKVRKVVRRVQAELNCGILYTSHNMKDIEEVCDRVIFLHKGKIVMEGSPAEIVERSQGASLEDVFIKIARDGEIVDEAAKPTSAEPS